MIEYKKLIDNRPFFIAGPCVIESMELLQRIAEKVKSFKDKYRVEIIFKASFDKANRTSLGSFRGHGMQEGLRMLEQIKKDFGLSLTTDIHESSQAAQAAEVIDILQIPAFLCRQTDLLIAAAQTRRIVNIKKGQFLSGYDMKYAVEKVKSSGNQNLLLTERGTMFGYNDLVVDFRNIPRMQSLGVPVVMDCTHAVQSPGGLGGKTGGNREFVPPLALAAKAFQADGYFFEIHPDPDHALSDGPNMITPEVFERVLQKLLDK